jgi:hypothetical protein
VVAVAPGKGLGQAVSVGQVNATGNGQRRQTAANVFPGGLGGHLQAAPPALGDVDAITISR